MKLLLFFAGYSSTEIQRTCKRCQLNVIESDGVYNILVENVRLGVDEYYECQVSPGKGATNSVPLRAPVHITIQGKEIEIIHRLFLVIAMCCQVSSSQFNESLNLPRC